MAKKRAGSRVVLITGATSGIGHHAALHLARRGHRILATGRRGEALATLQATAATEGLVLHATQLDVTRREQIKAAQKWIDERTDGQGIDVLVNSAGYGTVGPLEVMTHEDIRVQYETNIFGLLEVTKAFLPAMRQRGSGRIVNVGSMVGRVTFPLFGLYNSTKYALRSLSDALRMELAPFGVQVVLIEPGVIQTGFADRSMQEVAKYRTGESPYKGVLDRMDRLRRLLELTAVGPSCISRAIRHAIEARRPRARYTTPLRARLLVALLQMLPISTRDALLRRLAGLTRTRLQLVAIEPGGGR